MRDGAIRAFHHKDFDPLQMVRAKDGRRVSVCIPARDEAATVGDVVGVVVRELVERHGIVDEVLVLDDHSCDDTAAVARAAGADVAAAAEVLPECGPGAGKGEALWKSLAATSGDLVVWCDADITGFGPHFVTGLLGPLLLRDDVSFVKGFYERPLDGRPGQGGRVTELVARPLLSLLLPHLSGVVQPLAGEYAGRRELLERLPFAEGYAVDLGLLVDAAALVGVEGLAQVDLGSRTHRNRPLAELSPQAMAVLQVALARAGVPRRPSWSSTLVRPGAAPVDVPVTERPPLVEVPTYRRRGAA